MPSLSDFQAFYQLADRLIDEASKEQVAEVARLLALNVAHYQLKYGELPLETFEEMMAAQEIDPETAKILPPARKPSRASGHGDWQRRGRR